MPVIYQCPRTGKTLTPDRTYGICDEHIKLRTWQNLCQLPHDATRFMCTEGETCKTQGQQRAYPDTSSWGRDAYEEKAHWGKQEEDGGEATDAEATGEALARDESSSRPPLRSWV